MRRLFIILLVLLLLLCGCQTAKPDGASVMEYAGIPWNATSAQALQILGLTEEDVEITEGDYYCTVIIKGYEAFGQTTKHTALRFENVGVDGGEIGLAGIEFFYDESADVDALIASLEAAYGPGATELTQYMHNINGNQWSTLTGSEDNLYWQSQAVLDDVISQTIRSNAWEYMSQIEEHPYNKESFEYYLTKPATYIYLDTNYHSEKYGKVMVSINAGNYALFLQKFAD